MRIHKNGAMTAAAAAALALLPLVGATPAARAADSCTQNWSISSGQGYANGQWCNYNTKVKGTVHDNHSDGRCPFVRGYLTTGGYVDSPWATGNGTSRSFTLTTSSGSFSSLSMQYIVC